MIDRSHLFPDLYGRILDMQDNFEGFVRSECGLTPCQYFYLLRHPGQCSPEQEKIILRIARALAVDLLAAIRHHRKALHKA
jgi:hypothetical protein